MYLIINLTFVMIFCCAAVIREKKKIRGGDILSFAFFYELWFMASYEFSECYIVPFVLVVIVEFVFPYIMRKVKTGSGIRRIISDIESIWNNTKKSFYMFGLIGLFFALVEEKYTLLIILCMAILTNIVMYMFIKKDTLIELHEVYSASIIVSMLISIVVLGMDALTLHVDTTFVIFLFTFIIVLLLYFAKIIDSNEGMTFWILSTQLCDIHKSNIKRIRIKKRFINLLLPISLLMILAYVENTIEFYYVNRKIFEFSISTFWGMLIFQAIMVSICFSFLGTLFNSKVSKYISCIVFGIDIAVYLQVMFFNRILGFTDLSTIVWSKYNREIIWNSLVWFMCILIPVILYKKFQKGAIKWIKYASCVLILVQIATSMYYLLKSGGYNNTPEAKPTDYYVSSDEEFTVSRDKNIIVFILDTFSNDYIDIMLEKYPNALNEFHDFTYFNNYDSKYDGTALAMNYLLTGEEFDNTLPCKEFSQKVFSSEKVVNYYQNLHNQGFSCNYYMDSSTTRFLGASNLYGLFDNVKMETDVESITDNQKIKKNILRGSFYRCFPLGIKRYQLIVTSDFEDTVKVIGREDDTLKLNDSFYDLVDSVKFNNNEGNYNIYHFEGMHAFDDIKDTQVIADAAYKNMQDVLKYINNLKKIGVYDNSVIIITADHGRHETINGIQPILFVKEVGAARDTVKINSAPVSAEEYMPTILKLANMDYEEYGKTIYDYSEDDERERIVYVRKRSGTIKDIIKGNSSSIYQCLYGYKYTGNKENLRSKDEDKPDVVLPLIDFWH